MDKSRPIEKCSAAKTGVISLDVLEGLKTFQQTGEPDFVTELIDLFLKDTTLQLESLRVAVSNKNVPEIRRLAHLVKGSSGNIGATGMAELCQEMERHNLGTCAHESYGETLLLNLEAEFRQVSEAFKAHRQESSRQ
jgi:HPt (histidine-containing phosphotransfer) domain-containing protein